MDSTMLDEWRMAIGRTEESRDTVTQSLVDRFRATLGRPRQQGGDAPLGIHWCLSPAAVPPSGMDRDGHPLRGGFIPAISLPRRMWAGGALHLLAPIAVGETIRRVSRIADITAKSGRSGDLVFVTVEHEIWADEDIAIRERQDIVYRDAVIAGAPAVDQPASDAAPSADHSCLVVTDEVMLFRYSALTFNAHRIHYDLPYATQKEGYAGLVVHGPLLATLLLNYAADVTGRSPANFSFRGIKPLILDGQFSIHARQTADALSLWSADDHGNTTFTAITT